MATVDVVNQENKKVGSLDLNPSVFSAKVNVALVHQVIKAQLAARRQGTAETRTKAETRGSGKKPYRQKGTGNARRGNNRSSLMVGGGSNHSPHARSYVQGTPKEMVRGALRSALSDRLGSARLLVVDEFKFETPKTKLLDGVLKNAFKLNKVLIVDDSNKSLERMGRNIPHVRVLDAAGINVYDIVRHDWLILTKKAAESIGTRLDRQEAAKAGEGA